MSAGKRQAAQTAKKAPIRVPFPVSFSVEEVDRRVLLAAELLALLIGVHIEVERRAAHAGVLGNGVAVGVARRTDDEHLGAKRNDALIHRNGANVDRRACGRSRAHAAVARGIGRAGDLHGAREVDGIAGLHQKVAAAVALGDNGLDRVAALRLVDERADIADLSDGGIVLLLHRLAGNELAIGVHDLVNDVACAVDALLHDLRLALGDAVGRARQHSMLGCLDDGLIVGEVGTDGDLDRFVRHVDQHHLERADRDLQAAQQCADALARTRGGVLGIAAVRHGHLFAGRERDFRVIALRAGDDDALLRDRRRAVQHADRVAVGDEIQRVSPQLGRTVQQHHRGKEHEKHRSSASLGCEHLFQKLQH